MNSVTSAALVVGVLAGSAACGGGSTAPSPPPSSGPITITIVGDRGSQSFSPNPVTAAGRTVVFRNSDSVVHRVRLNDLSIDTGDIAPGATSNPVNMPAAGTNYHCQLHPGMIGAVGGGSTAPPPCQGIYC
jgi:plastocyanin